jgi:copper(I)-binding protein
MMKERPRRAFLAGLACATLTAAAAAVFAVSTPARAHGVQLGAIAIGHPWARATVPGQPIGAGYLSLDNRGTADDRLVAGRTAAAERVELHAMWMEGDVMRMRQRDAIDLPAGSKVELRPGGSHLMLVGLKAPLKAGDRFPLTLTFEKAGTVEVVVYVQAEAPGGGRGGTAPSPHGDMHH